MARKRSGTPARPRRAAGKSRTAAGPAPAPGAMRVSQLEQVKVMAHPLRLRMLELFGEAPRTAKQVAGLLGEKPTRLYHHVDAMARVGLIELTETRQVRGATEKYYRAAARRFEIGQEAFAAAGKAAGAGSAGMIRTVVDATRNEVLDFFGAEHPRPPVSPVIARAMVRGSREEIEAIRTRLMELLELRKSAPGKRAKGGKSEALTYSLALMFYPAPEE